MRLIFRQILWAIGGVGILIAQESIADLNLAQHESETIQEFYANTHTITLNPYANLHIAGYLTNTNTGNITLDKHATISVQGYFENAALITLGEYAAMSIEGEFRNSGSVGLDSAANIAVGGAFVHSGALSFVGTSNHRFGSISAQSITLDANSQIVLDPQMAVFGEYKYTLLSSTQDPIVDNGVSVGIESNSEYARYIDLTHILSEDSKSLSVEFSLNDTAKATSISTINAAATATLSSHDKALLEYLKNHNQTFGVGVVSALLSSDASQNIAQLTQALHRAQDDVYDQSLYDAMAMSWIGSGAQVALRLNQRADSAQSSSADVWADLLVGTSRFGAREQSLFGFHSGIDKRFGEHILLGVALGYIRGASEVSQAINHSAQYVFANLYGRVFDTHNELDIGLYGMSNFAQMARYFALWGFGSTQQSEYNPYAFGGTLLYGYVFRLSSTSAHFLKPILGFNVHYAHQPGFSESGALPVGTSTSDLSYQSLEVGAEYRFKNARGSYLYIKPSYEFLLHSLQNTPYTQIVDSGLPLDRSAFVLPRGFVNLLVGGEISYRERMVFSINASYKQAIDAQDSRLERVAMNMLSVWGGVKFGF